MRQRLKRSAKHEDGRMTTIVYHSYFVLDFESNFG